MKPDVAGQKLKDLVKAWKAGPRDDNAAEKLALGVLLIAFELDEVTANPGVNDIRSVLVLRGSSLRAFAREHGFNPAFAYRIINGEKRSGPRVELFRKIVSEQLGIAL